MNISNSMSSWVLIISTLLVATIVAGCSSSLNDSETHRVAESTALNGNSITVFQPTT